MQLTEDERAALELHRARREAYPDHDDPTNRFRLQTDETVTLADMALRLFPVRTYGDLVIRWDDPITPEKLLACGFKLCESNSSYLFVSSGLNVKLANVLKWYVPWEDCQPIWNELTPRNMGEVWNLMERCGIEEGGK